MINEIPGQRIDHSTVGARREVRIFRERLKEQIKRGKKEHGDVIPFTKKTSPELDAEVESGWVSGIAESQTSGDKE